MPTIARRLGPLLLVAALAAPLALASGTSSVRAADPADFPAGYTGYHTYQEMRAEVVAAAAAHPDIVRWFSIGKSYQGRDLIAAKVSDNVAVDEREPEVLFEGGHHSDEHMGTEMALRILGWLTDGYGSDPRITRIVDNREIWILFNANPDGSTYDISGGRFHFWRKNRQPTPGSSSIGTDLNRNYGYKWGTAGNTSTNPAAITYRGPSAFSAPETRAVRDFLASRVVGGRQQIRASISFHEYGRLVMWPYGYTYLDVPGDMTVDDHAALVGIGRKMAASNGYRPEQGSDLYLSAGTTRDHLYGTYRVFSYTFELSNDDYLDDSLIASETSRNREAALYLMEQAWCPYAVLGTATRQARCGVFDDDLEVARGWKVNADGTDTATAGAWQRGHPAATSTDGPKQLGTVTSGSAALVTGLATGVSASANDVDGGRTTVTSPAIRLATGAGQRLTFRWTFAHDIDSGPADELRVQVVGAAGVATTVLVRTGAATDLDGAWHSASIDLDPWAGATVRVRFTATDGGRASLVEAAIDDVRVTTTS